jgi:para-aminobenzoate synthetase component I
MPLKRTQIEWRDPVSAFAPLRDEPFALLLHGPGSRWSYICARPAETLLDDVATAGEWAQRLRQTERQRGISRPDDAPPFIGGWAGLLSYEFGRALLPHLGNAPRRAGWPDIALGFYDEFIVFDHERRTAQHWDWTGGRAQSLPEILGERKLPLVSQPLSRAKPAPKLPSAQYEELSGQPFATVRFRTGR